MSWQIYRCIPVCRIWDGCGPMAREVYAKLQSIFFTGCRRVLSTRRLYRFSSYFPLRYVYCICLETGKNRRDAWLWWWWPSCLLLWRYVPIGGHPAFRIKYFWVFIAVPPLFVGKGIWAKVDEHIVFHLLPVILMLCRNSAVWLGCGGRLRKEFAMLTKENNAAVINFVCFSSGWILFWWRSHYGPGHLPPFELKINNGSHALSAA